jgi:hypothetical protein
MQAKEYENRHRELGYTTLEERRDQLDLQPVLRIWDVYPGSRIRNFPSRILGQKDSRIRIKEFKYGISTLKFVFKLSKL